MAQDIVKGMQDLFNGAVGQGAAPGVLTPDQAAAARIKALTMLNKPRMGHGVTNGGRHDSRRGAVLHTNGQPDEMVMAPNMGTSAFARRAAESSMDQTGGPIPIPQGDPRQLIKNGGDAVMRILQGGNDPKDHAAIEAFLTAAQSGRLNIGPQKAPYGVKMPQNPIMQIIRQLRKAGLVTKGNLYANGRGSKTPNTEAELKMVQQQMGNDGSDKEPDADTDDSN